MPHADIKLEGDGAHPEWKNKPIYFQNDPNGCVHFTAMPHGTSEGRPSVIITVDSPEGLVHIETTMRIFQSVAAAFRGRYGEV